MFSGMLYGLRISLAVGVHGSALFASVVVDFAWLARRLAWRSSGSPAILMRLVDLQLSFPAILVALMIPAIIGKGVG